MKYVRYLAILPLVLISLLNLGYPMSTTPRPALALSIGAIALGVAGFVAAFGLARDLSWGGPTAVAVAVGNVVGAVVALLSDSEGALIGMILSAVALLLAFLVGQGRDRAATEWTA